MGRPNRSVRFLALLLVLNLPPLVAGAEPPRGRLVATGGTISNRTGSRMTAEELVAQIPGLNQYCRPEHEQFANVSSGALTLAQYLDLSKRLNQIFRSDRDLAGLVVTSGTDRSKSSPIFWI